MVGLRSGPKCLCNNPYKHILTDSTCLSLQSFSNTRASNLPSVAFPFPGNGGHTPTSGLGDLPVAGVPGYPHYGEEGAARRPMDPAHARGQLGSGLVQRSSSTDGEGERQEDDLRQDGGCGG